MSILVSGGLLFGACGEDRTFQYMEKTGRCQWIYDVMNQWYLRNSEMIQPSEAQFFGEPETFFNKLLDIRITAMKRYSAHRSTFRLTAISTRKGNLKSFRCCSCIIKKHLIEITESVHKDKILVLILELHEVFVRRIDGIRTEVCILHICMLQSYM